MYRFFCNEHINILKQYTPVFHLCLLGSSNPGMLLKLIAELPCIHEDQDLALCMLTFFSFLKTVINWSSDTSCVWCFEAYRAHGALQGLHALCVLCYIVGNRHCTYVTHTTCSCFPKNLLFTTLPMAESNCHLCWDEPHWLQWEAPEAQLVLKNWPNYTSLGMSQQVGFT